MSRGLGRLHGRGDAKTWVLRDEEQFADRPVRPGREGELGEMAQLAPRVQPGEPGELGSGWLKDEVVPGGEVGGKEARAVDRARPGACEPSRGAHRDPSAGAHC